MNVFKLSCCLVTTVVISGFMHAMEEKPCLQLSTIEKQLILREVEKRGKDCILSEIHKKGQSHSSIMHDKKAGMCFFRNCMVFKIHETFYKKNIETDTLTKNIFDTIEVVEKEKGYFSEYAGDSDFDNVLGERTIYWWLKDADNNYLPSIQVQFRPHYYSSDQKALENFINSCNQ